MNSLVLVTCLVAVAFGQNARPLDDIIAQVISETDIDQNGIITVEEFQTELLTKWANGAESVGKEDFILLWTTTYGDDPETTAQFFDNMDVFIPKGVINELDLLMLFPSMDSNGDGNISTQELDAFIHWKHPYGTNQMK